MIRRLKNEVLSQLPDKTRQIVRIIVDNRSKDEIKH